MRELYDLNCNLKINEIHEKSRARDNNKWIDNNNNNNKLNDNNKNKRIYVLLCPQFSFTISVRKRQKGKTGKRALTLKDWKLIVNNATDEIMVREIIISSFRAISNFSD